jgi:hypothetical protein
MGGLLIDSRACKRCAALLQRMACVDQPNRLTGRFRKPTVNAEYGNSQLDDTNPQFINQKDNKCDSISAG